MDERQEELRIGAIAPGELTLVSNCVAPKLSHLHHSLYNHVFVSIPFFHNCQCLKFQQSAVMQRSVAVAVL